MSDISGLLVSVVGPTAVGKTSFGIELARHFTTEVVSVDSRQFYREMEIGTAKPTEEERALAHHHFVNNLSIHDAYNVGQFERECLELLNELFKRKQIVIAVGGSGLFFKALWEGMDDMPEILPGLREELNQLFVDKGIDVLTEELKDNDPVYYEQVDLKNHQRVIRALEVIRSTGKPFSDFRIKKANPRPFDVLKLGIEMDREQLYDRIDRRMDMMIEQGLFEEAERLYPNKDHYALQTVGYSEIFGFMDGKYDRVEAVRLLKRNSRRYAKRQMTWFKADPEIVWLSPDGLKQAIELIEKKLSDA